MLIFPSLFYDMIFGNWQADVTHLTSFLSEAQSAQAMHEYCTAQKSREAWNFSCTQHLKNEDILKSLARNSFNCITFILP